ncbi:phosphoadenylyl-sulfate reductase [Phellopilus nigrolimitatus]|nr:phosphoadenylyl-sulfate reductase [Phellopilus nigrolimitatus]
MSALSEPVFSKPLQHPVDQQLLENINSYLHTLSPQEVLRWGLENLPNLHQTTAFGLTGLAQLDMLSTITSCPPPLIFIDTLYHFNETLELVEQVKRRYGRDVHSYRPEGCETTADFEKMHGERLWERNEAAYDYLVKVEPARRAYAELDVRSVITGRRASQGASRKSLQPLEVDSTGLFKLNPLFSWNFSAVQTYIKEHDVPRNALLDQGYKSVGDWHSTQKSGEGDDGERAGRWAGRTEKTECGLHEDYFTLRLQMLKNKREAELREKDEARGDGAKHGLTGTAAREVIV